MGENQQIMAIPANIEAALEKAPPQVQTYVKNVFGVLDNESELRSRSTACALAILSLWSISCFPYISIFVAIVVALDPPSVAPVAAMVEPQLRNVLPQQLLLSSRTSRATKISRVQIASALIKASC